MGLTTKSVAWHVGSIAAGAWGMAVFAQTNSVDLFAMFAQLKKTWGEMTVLGTMLWPFIMAGAAAYRTWGSKQVPTDSIAIQTQGVSQKTVDDNKGSTMEVVGKVVGALLLAVLLFAPGQTLAGPIADKIAADTAAKLEELRATIVVDLTAARDDAKANQDPAEICWQVLLNHANTMPPKLMGLAHTAQRARTLRRSIPAISDACAVVKDGAKQALLTIFGVAAGGASGLAAFGL